MSIAAIASIRTPPERPVKVRNIFCQRGPASNGSAPSTRGVSCSSISVL